MRNILTLILCLIAGTDPITTSNVDRLTLIHTVDGLCAAFNTDETTIATTNGLFDLNSGEIQINRTENPTDYAEWVWFSPDGEWLVIGETIYAADTDEPMLTLDYPQALIAFSEDGQFVHIEGITYDTETWQPIEPDNIADFTRFNGANKMIYVWRDLATGSGIPTYLSPQGNYWVHVLEGIYDVNSGELLTLPDTLNDPSMLDGGSFSADDALFFPTMPQGDVIAYRLPTFESITQLPQETPLAVILPEAVWVFNQDHSLGFATFPDQTTQIYDVATEEVMLVLSGISPLLSVNERYLALSNDSTCDVYAIQ